MSKRKIRKKVRRKKQREEIPISPELMAALKEQERRFVEKFGREPGPGDPVFFDPDEDEPTPLTEEKIDQALGKALEASSAKPELAYPMAKTGRMVTEENLHRLSEEEVEEWQEAIEEYRQLTKH
jgi:hypothetical protein